MHLYTYENKIPYLIFFYPCLGLQACDKLFVGLQPGPRTCAFCNALKGNPRPLDGSLPLGSNPWTLFTTSGPNKFLAALLKNTHTPVGNHQLEEWTGHGWVPQADCN